MAEVTFEDARAAREQSQRLRSDSAGLKLVMRSRTRAAETQAAEAGEAVAALQARRAIPLASPWSGLDWLLEDDSLEHILLPVD
jgi:hypothetical protein